ncbi:MAG: hypothetical protein ACR2KQ_03425 [Actinomycetota bacterium]
MRFRLLFVTGAIFCASLPGGIAAPNVACAAESSAALVVATGGTTYRYCVSLPAASVSGIDLIRLAGEQHGLQYSLGYGGRAVCQLAGVGPEGDDCFADHPNFWGYWRGNGSGGWNWSSTGGGSTTVRSGDVEGWAWGRGQDGNTHPRPPATTYGSVCTSSPEGSGGSGGSTGKAGSGGGSGGGSDKKDAPPPGTTEGATEADNRADVTEGAAENDDGAGKRGQKKKQKEKDTADTDLADDTSAEALGESRPGERELAGPAPVADEGPPTAGVVGLGLAVLFGLLGARLAARRQRRVR